MMDPDPSFRLTSPDGRQAHVSPLRSLSPTRFAHASSIFRESGAIAHRSEWRWMLPPTAVPRLVSAMRAGGFGLDIVPEVAAMLNAAAAALESAHSQGMDPRLYPYQREGIGYLRARQRALIADEMGLGKTAQLAAALHGDAPALVVCPALAKGVWERELRTWAPGRKVSLLSGRGSFRWPLMGEAVVINYDVLPSHGSVLPPPGAGTVLIADEAHYLKGAGTARAKAARALVRHVLGRGGRAWGATGTPLASWPPDLYRVLDVFGLALPAFGGWTDFVRLFRGVKKQWGGWTWGTPDPSVPSRLSRVMLRRTRAQVLPQVPSKTYSDVSVPLSAADRRSISELLLAAGVVPERLTEEVLRKAVSSAHISRARQILAAGKIAAALEWADAAEEAGEPAVVFSAHRAPIDRFLTRRGWRVITGDTPHEDRTRFAAELQDGTAKGIAATIPAGGVAITLTRAAMALFVDLEWTPASNAQAEDRLCRIGQTRPVTIYRLVADHPLDSKVTEILTAKSRTLGASVEAVTATSDSAIASEMRRCAEKILLDCL